MESVFCLRRVAKKTDKSGLNLGIFQRVFRMKFSENLSKKFILELSYVV